MEIFFQSVCLFLAMKHFLQIKADLEAQEMKQKSCSFSGGSWGGAQSQPFSLFPSSIPEKPDYSVYELENNWTQWWRGSL